MNNQLFILYPNMMMLMNSNNPNYSDNKYVNQFQNAINQVAMIIIQIVPNFQSVEVSTSCHDKIQICLGFRVRKVCFLNFNI